MATVRDSRSSRESATSTSTASRTRTRRRTTSSSPAGGSRTRSSRRSRRTRTSRSGCASSGCKSLDYFIARPMPTWGGDLSAIDFDNIFYYIRPTEKQAKSWDDVPAGHQGHVRQAGHPGGRAEVPRRRRRPVRVGGRLPQAPGGPREAGRDLPRHGLRPARARGARQAVLRHDHPAERQQVRGAEHGGLVGRLVHLRAARACTSRCRCRPTSASTPRTWASSSAR